MVINKHPTVIAMVMMIHNGFSNDPRTRDFIINERYVTYGIYAKYWIIGGRISKG
jgi:hypothetical protein